MPRKFSMRRKFENISPKNLRGIFEELQRQKNARGQWVGHLCRRTFMYSCIVVPFGQVWPIDAHGLKIQGRGYLMFFPKIPRGSRFSGKIAWGGGPYFGFHNVFFINKCFEICLRGVLYLPSPLCASMVWPLIFYLL